MAQRVEVEIAAKATGFVAEFNKISSAATAAGSKIRGALSGIQSAGAAIGVSLSAAGLAYFIKSTIDAADRLNDLSKATQVSAVTLGGIGFAAQQAGTDLDGTAKAFGKLNLLVADAQAGNQKALETFGKLGITIRDLRNDKPEEIFAKAADAFASFDDGANKAAGANAVFGKSYASVLPLLDEGGDALRKNVEYFERYSGVSQEVIDASDQFNDSLTKLNLLNQAFGKELVRQLLPPLQKFVDYLVEGKEKSAGFSEAAGRIVDSLKLLTQWAVGAVLTFRDVGEIIGATAAQIGAIVSLDFSRASAIGDDLDARLAKSKQTYEDFKKILNTTAPAAVAAKSGGGRGRGRPAPNFGDAGSDGGKTKVDEFARALERVSKLAAEADLELAGMFSTQEVTSAQKALAALTSSDEWKKFTEPQRQDLTNRFAAIDAVERETLAWKKKNEEHAKAIKLFEEEQQAQQQAVANFTATLGQYADENSYLERSIELVGKDDVARQKLAATIEFESLKKQALLADDQAGLAILEEQFKKRIELIDQLAEASDRFAKVQQINTIFADAFADSLVAVVDGTKSVKDAFSDMARSITSAISRIAAQNLADALFGVGPGKTGGPGELFAKLLGGSGGGGGGFDFSKILQSIFGLFGGGGGISPGAGFGGGGGLGFAANGTDFARGGMTMVGERGPEILNIPRGAQVIPNDVLRGKRAERAISVTNNFTVSGQTSRASQHQIAARAAQAVSAAGRRM